MKVSVEFDCTPDEARRFMGLPDVEKVNSVCVDAVTKAMQGVTSVDQLEAYTRQIAPMGQLGLKLFQNFMDSTRDSMAPGREHKPGRSGE